VERSFTMEKIQWPDSLGDWLLNYDPQDEIRYRMHKRYKLLMQLVKHFYEIHWPGSWRKIKHKFSFYDMKVVGGWKVKGGYKPALPKCIVCRSQVSPFYQPRGYPLDKTLEFPFSSLPPVPKKIPDSLSFGGFLPGKTTLGGYGYPEFAICENGHAFFQFQTHNTTRFGMLSYHYMWSKEQKRLVSFRSDEIDPVTGREHPPNYYNDAVAELRKEYTNPLVGIDHFSKPVDLSSVTVTKANIEEIEAIVQHFIQIDSIRNAVCGMHTIALLAPERCDIFRNQIDWMWDKIKNELSCMARRGSLDFEYTLGIALVHPEKAQELRKQKWFSDFIVKNVQAILEMNPQEGWSPASETALVARFYYPDLLENKDVQEAVWFKGTRKLLPQLQRGHCDPHDIARLRLLYPQRFSEIQPKGDNLNYILRRAVRSYERSREEERKYKRDGSYNFSAKPVMNEIFNIKLITAKEVSINSDNFELRIGS
jgi:hypothetical protein